jgi:hypothetical protein
MTNGIAHVSFAGGGMFVPARSPYDRQLLMESILTRARVKGQVQVLLDGQRWMVYGRVRTGAVCCAQCGFAVDSACYLVPRDGTPYCVSCAFVELAPPTQSPPVGQRKVS